MKYEWKKYTVQELIDLNMIEEPLDGNHGSIHPKATDYVSSGIPFIMAKDLIDGSVDYNSCAFITEEQAKLLRKGFAKPGDVLLTHKATIGRTSIVSNEYKTVILTPQVTYYRVKNGISNRFLKYYFDSSEFQQILGNWAGAGSTRAYLGITAQRKLPIVLPPYEIQDKIASVLNAIDEKIELNKKVNDNLEQQANLFFDEVVGRHIPTLMDSNSKLHLHEIGSLDVLITDYVANGSFKSLADNVQYLTEETDNVLIRLTDYNNNFSSDMVYISDESYEFLSKSKLYGDEIIISNVGVNVGTVFRCPRLNKRMSLAPNAIMLRSAKYEHYLYLYFTSNYGQQQLQSIVTGSAQPKFNKTNFRSLKVVLPNEAVLSEITKLYIPMYEKIVSNLRENKTLAEMRDILLPKLISGEIDLSEIQF